MKKTTNEDGFTVIEMIVFFVILVILAVFFVLQKMDLETSYADQTRKTDINALYYNLTEVYYPEHKYYPSSIDDNTLRGIDFEALYDESDYAINDSGGAYKYEGLNCNQENHCQGFKLTAHLEKEDDYIKTSEK